MFDQELECCGAEFEKSHISFIGLLTFSFPLLVLCVLIRIISYPITFFIDLKIIQSLINANLKLIKQKNMLSRYKCQMASFIFKISPRLSGIVFKYFNVSILCIFWFVFIFIVSRVISL